MDFQYFQITVTITYEKPCIKFSDLNTENLKLNQT